MSYSNKIIQDKVFDYRTRNPLPALWGRLKGGVEGTLYSLGNSLFLVGSSALALTAKNVFAKIGATGVALTACYNVFTKRLRYGQKTSYGLSLLPELNKFLAGLRCSFTASMNFGASSLAISELLLILCNPLFVNNLRSHKNIVKNAAQSPRTPACPQEEV